MARCIWIVLLPLALAPLACAGDGRRPDEGMAAEAATGTPIEQATARAAAGIEAARRDVAAGEGRRASERLDAAREDLRALSALLPGETFAASIDAAIEAIRNDPATADFTALQTQAEELRARLDPAIFQAVEDARFALLAGDAERAGTRLEEARKAFGADTQRTELAAARALLDRAGEEVADRDFAAAERSLAEASAAADRLGALAPFVPIRWELRAAARSAEEGDWDAAERLLAAAVTQIEDLSRVNAALAGQLLDDARRLLDGWKRQQLPSPEQIWDLALRTLEATAG